MTPQATPSLEFRRHDEQCGPFGFPAGRRGGPGGGEQAPGSNRDTPEGARHGQTARSSYLSILSQGGVPRVSDVACVSTRPHERSESCPVALCPTEHQAA